MKMSELTRVVFAHSWRFRKRRGGAAAAAAATRREGRKARASMTKESADEVTRCQDFLELFGEKEELWKREGEGR